MNKLEDLRFQLLQINQELISKMTERQNVVHEIQKEKVSNSLSVFCADREKILFNQMSKDLKSLSLRQLLSFSLLIEDDANSFSKTYPAWSQKVHLTKHTNELYELINPILLKAYDPELFFKLTLSQDFDFIGKL